MKMTLGAFEPLVLCDGGGAGVKGTGSFSERRRRPPSPTPRADPARMEYLMKRRRDIFAAMPTFPIFI